MYLNTSDLYMKLKICIYGYLPSRNGFMGSMMAHNCATVNGAEQTIYVTITAMVCLTVLILAREMKGVLRFEQIFCELRGRKLDSELCQISLQMQV